jgi:hypothetical protein
MAKQLVVAEVAPAGFSVFHGVLSADEQDIIRKLLSSTETAEKIIPDDPSLMDAETLWKYLAASCKAMSRVNDAISKLKPLVGRMLIVIQKHPDLYESQGYRTYDDFMTRGVPSLFSISRPEAYNAKNIANNLGFLNPPEMAEIGMTKLRIVASAMKASTIEGMPQELVDGKRKEWVDAAKTMNVADLRAKQVTDGQCGPGENEYGAINIVTSKATKERWNDFRKNPLIIGFVDGKSLIDCMIDECEASWIPQAEEAMRQK